MARVRNKGNKAQGSIHLANNTIVDGDYLTIGSKVYEFDDDAAVTSGRVLVTIGGSAAATAANLIAAINANKPSRPVTAAIDPTNVSGQKVNLIADRVGAAGNIALTENVANAGLTVSGATLLGGENASEQDVARGQYVVTAADILADGIVIETGLTSPRFPITELRTTAGLIKAATYLLTISGSKLIFTFAGATDPIAGDVLRWACWE